MQRKKASKNNTGVFDSNSNQQENDNTNDEKKQQITSGSGTLFATLIMLCLATAAVYLYRDKIPFLQSGATTASQQVMPEDVYQTLVGGVNPFIEQDKFLFYGKQHIISNGQLNNASSVATPEALIWHKEEEGWHNLLEVHKMFFEQGSGLKLGNLTNGALFSIHDGELQVYEQTDEVIVAEYVTALPLLYLEQPSVRVLIIGGMDGLMLRKVLTDKRVKRVTMVGTEKRTIDAVKQHFVSVHNNSFADARVQMEYDLDTMEYLKQESGEEFDLIIVANHHEHASKETQAMIKICKKRLSKVGILAMQNEANKPDYPVLQHYLDVQQAGYDHVVYHKRTLLSVGDWGFVLASQGTNFMKKQPSAYQKRFQAIQGKSHHTKSPILRYIVPSRLPSMFYLEGNDKYLIAKILKQRRDGTAKNAIAERESAIVILKQ